MCYPFALVYLLKQSKLNLHGMRRSITDVLTSLNSVSWIGCNRFMVMSNSPLRYWLKILLILYVSFVTSREQETLALQNSIMIYYIYNVYITPNRVAIKLRVHLAVFCSVLECWPNSYRILFAFSCQQCLISNFVCM